MGNPAPEEEKALPMPNLQQSGLLSYREIPSQQNATSGEWPPKFFLI
jgi:hypothetical protein